MKQLFVRSTLLSDVAGLCLQLGLDPVAMLRKAELSPEHLDERDRHVPIASIVEMLETVAVESKVDDIGLRVALARGLPDLGPVSLLLRENRTVRDAIWTLARSLILHTDGLFVLPEVDAEPPMVMVNIVSQRSGNCRQATELAVAGLAQLLRWMLGESWSPTEVYFLHAHPPTASLHRATFRCPVMFGAEFNGIVLRPEDLERQLPGSSPAFRGQLDEYIKLLGPAASDAFVYRVTRLITAALPKGESDAVTIANALGTDRRTMNRRLDRQGLNFSGVVEEVRKSMATQHLLGSDKSLSEVAELLGFASLSAFSRWHRRTTGIPASEWRHRHR